MEIVNIRSFNMERLAFAQTFKKDRYYRAPSYLKDTNKILGFKIDSRQANLLSTSGGDQYLSITIGGADNIPKFVKQLEKAAIDYAEANSAKLFNTVYDRRKILRAFGTALRVDKEGASVITVKVGPSTSVVAFNAQKSSIAKVFSSADSRAEIDTIVSLEGIVAGRMSFQLELVAAFVRVHRGSQAFVTTQEALDAFGAHDDADGDIATMVQGAKGPLRVPIGRKSDQCIGPDDDNEEDDDECDDNDDDDDIDIDDNTDHIIKPTAEAEEGYSAAVTSEIVNTSADETPTSTDDPVTVPSLSTSESVDENTSVHRASESVSPKKT
ncbi:hypothetical protein HDU93_010028 [Gonapodya sp. JEL0774]|nr:hypothetical protein HDU93_010028 [Gonapodya sp. JEL0774]